MTEDWIRKTYVAPADCECNECISCCEKLPGWFLPSQIKTLREFLNISYEELYKEYLLIDYWVVNEGDIDVIAPGSINEVGRKAPFEYPFRGNNVCVFLKNNKCSIHEVKPFECKMAGHYKSGREDGIREKIAELWDCFESGDIIKKLKGENDEN